MITAAQGRGAWTGVAGTLNAQGNGPGPYYRAPTGGGMAMPGSVGAYAAAHGLNCDVNHFAVYMAVRAIQAAVFTPIDGVFGPATGAQVKKWQSARADTLAADGIVGQGTAFWMFRPVLGYDSKQPHVHSIASGHVHMESAYDPGAVGSVTWQDVGLCQVNGPSHPDVSMSMALTPSKVLPWMVKFVAGNISAMGGNVRDGIAAYNLGVGGAQAWVRYGRPNYFNGAYVNAYINAVLAAAD